MRIFKLLLLCALLLATTCWAQAPWDGTKGNLTVKTLYSEPYTHIQVRSSDQSVHAFLVTAFIIKDRTASAGETPAERMIIQVAADMGGSVIPTATFQCRILDIKALSVSEIKFGDNQWFASSF